MAKENSFTGPWAICGRCNGDGGHSHRLGAFTLDEFNQDFDDEEQERYFAGGYDETCEVCGGSGKVRTPANEEEREEAQADAEVDAEQRYWQRVEAYACGERE